METALAAPAHEYTDLENVLPKVETMQNSLKLTGAVWLNVKYIMTKYQQSKNWS